MADSELLNVLEIDRQARNPGQIQTDDLWLLKDIDFKRDWDYVYPTLYADSSLALKNSLIQDIKNFEVLFNKKYGPVLSRLNYDNILIAGGAITSLLLQRNWDNDIDIFIYGLTEEEANYKVEEIIQNIYDSYLDFKSAQIQAEHKKDVPNQDIRGEIGANEVMNNIRNRHCISIQFNNGAKIQIILRLYNTLSEILHGFDLGSCAMGYDGKQVYFTSLGKFAYEYLANVIDPSRRSTTYEKRLLKYYERGFNIILPLLDMTKLPRDYLEYRLVEVCFLPYFTFSYKDVRDNKIYLDKMLKLGTNLKYDSDYQAQDLSDYEIFYLNLRTLVAHGGAKDFYHYSPRMNLDILNQPPYLQPSFIIDFYDKIADKLYRKGKFDIGVFKNYFFADLLPTMLNEFFIQRNYKYLKEIIETQKQSVLDLYKNLSQKTQLQWLKENPGTQLTSSFNPIISDSKDWYGVYYKPILKV